MLRIGKLLVALVAVLAVLALGTLAHASNDGAAHAIAVLKDANGQEVGIARLTEDATGTVHLNVHVKDISAGPHGIHIHSVARCDAPNFTSAGGHFNPGGHQHGLDNPHGSHAGDLPNLEVNGAGKGHLNTTTDQVTLSAGALSLFDADGSAFVIHAGPDDQISDPAGNSGARIACGIIVGE